jgi:hypothetical protein
MFFRREAFHKYRMSAVCSPLRAPAGRSPVSWYAFLLLTSGNARNEDHGGKANQAECQEQSLPWFPSCFQVLSSPGEPILCRSEIDGEADRCTHILYFRHWLKQSLPSLFSLRVVDGRQRKSQGHHLNSFILLDLWVGIMII